MVERKLSKKRYLLAFVFSAAIFSIGLLLGLLLTGSKLEFVEAYQQDFRTQSMTFDIQDDLLKENICDFEISEFDKEFNTLTEQVSVMEEQVGKNDPEVLRMKEYYSLLEIKHWMFMKQLKEECGRDYNFILYFYSNDEKECPDCQMQGYLLDYINQKFDNVFIYSFDTNIQNSALGLLKEKYKVNGMTVVINDQVNYGLIDKEQIESILG